MEGGQGRTSAVTEEFIAHLERKGSRSAKWLLSRVASQLARLLTQTHTHTTHTRHRAL